MTTPAESPSRAPTALDRLAACIVPPLGSLGGRGTVVSPLLLILVVSVATAGAVGALGWDVETDQPLVAALQEWMLVIAAFAPLLALIKAGVLAAFVWSLLALLGAAAPPRAILSALLYGEVLLALQAPVLLIVLAVSGGPQGGALLPSLGLDAFMDPSHPVLLALARGVTPFQIVWVAYLALAFASSARMSRTKGLAASGAVWALLAGLGALRAFLTGGGT